MKDESFPELRAALVSLLDRIDAEVRSGGYDGPPIQALLAGGMAVNFYCGTRYTADVDAAFSQRLLLPWRELTVDYVRADGSKSFIYIDPTYSPALSLLHEDYEDDVVEWPGIGNERRTVQLRVLAPVDLAVSKLGRFTSRDAEDILALAGKGLFTCEQFRRRAEEALAGYIGNARPVRQSIDLVCADIGP